VPGGRWDEPVAGTNGIGMALVTRQPVFVFADEALVQSGAGLGLLLGPRTHADR
jgi:transcriptional regulator of acetoin/glycerol metabolism